MKSEYTILEKGYVYMITSPNKRIYIGSSTNITERFKYYKKLSCKAQIKLYNSLVKYGVENHTFEILWEGNIEDMLKYEHLCGMYYETLTLGLNCRLPGYNDIPTIISEETKTKIKNTLTGRKLTGEKLSNFRLAMKNKVYTQEHRDKLRKAVLLRIDTIKKINAKKVIHIPTNKEFESIVETAKFFNLTPGYISDQLSGKRKNKLNLQFK